MNPVTIHIDKDGPNVVLTWEGGIGPFLLQESHDMSSWDSAGRPTMSLTRTLPADKDQAWFRVQEAVPLLDVDLEKEPTTLIWLVPELE